MTLSEILIFFSLHIQNKAEVFTTLFTQLISLFFFILCFNFFKYIQWVNISQTFIIPLLKTKKIQLIKVVWDNDANENNQIQNTINLNVVKCVYYTVIHGHCEKKR